MNARLLRSALIGISILLVAVIGWNRYRHGQEEARLADLSTELARQMTLKSMESPVCVAVHAGDRATVERELSKGDLVNASCGGSTAAFRLSLLQVAFETQNATMARLLLARGADPNYDACLLKGMHRYALVDAICMLPEVVPELLVHHAEPNIGNGEPLRWAIRRHRLDIVSLLLKQGAIVNPVRPASGINAVLYSTVLSGKERGHVTAGGYYSNSKSNWFNPFSPLATAICFAPEAEAMLRQAGATIDADRETILVDAVNTGHKELLSKLLAAGANINGASGNGQNETALTLAVAHMPDAVGWLLEHGAHPDTVNGSQETGLIIATRKGDLATAKLFLAHKADPNAHFGNGHTALYWARKGNHTDILQALQQAGATADL